MTGATAVSFVCMCTRHGVRSCSNSRIASRVWQLLAGVLQRTDNKGFSTAAASVTNMQVLPLELQEVGFAEFRLLELCTASKPV